MPTAERAPAALRPAAEFVRQHLSARLSELAHLDDDQIVEHRYAKFRRMGNFFA